MTLYKTFFRDANSLVLKSDYFIDVFKNSKYLDITAIDIDRKHKIKLGDRVPVTIEAFLEKPYDTYYIANKMYLDDRIAFISEYELNDTSLFILPLLEIDMKVLMLKSNFINGYIANTNNYNKIGDCVYMIYRYMPFKQYRDLITILSKQPNFISHEKSKDKRFDIIKISIPDRFKESVKLIFEGKYSKIPNHVKHTIVKKSHRQKDDIIYQTLFNSKELRKTMSYNLGIQERDLPENLRDKPNLKKETWI